MDSDKVPLSPDSSVKQELQNKNLLSTSNCTNNIPAPSMINQPFGLFLPQQTLHMIWSGNRSVFPDCDLKEKRIGHSYQSRAPPRHKKPRTSFTKNQITLLETIFLEQKYLASSERAVLASRLNMSDAQVKTWFQNRRTKWR